MWAILAEPDAAREQVGPRGVLRHRARARRRDLAELAGAGCRAANGRALDFGCGFGRLTLALAEHVRPGRGRRHRPVDDRAGQRAQHGRRADPLPPQQRRRPGPVRVRHVRPGAELIVLQHIENRYKAAYLREFLRILRPGGIASSPSRATRTWTPVGIVFRVLPNRLLNLCRKRRFGYEGVMELHGMPRSEVEQIVRGRRRRGRRPSSPSPCSAPTGARSATPSPARPERRPSRPHPIRTRRLAIGSAVCGRRGGPRKVSSGGYSSPTASRASMPTASA